MVFELHSLLVTKKHIGIEKVTFDGIKTMTSTTLITLFTLNANLGRVAKNILRLRELATITSKQEVIVPEQKLRALLSYEGFMQPGQTTN